MPSRAALESSRNAADRILRAAATLAVAHGVAHVSLQAVAEEAGVSKGLIHYHFHDRETLLARLGEWLAGQAVARERSALTGISLATALDRSWAWIEGELRLGQLRVLLDLGREPGALPQRAAREAAELRRRTGTETIVNLFRALQLSPRLPAPLLAEVMTAFIDGLVVHATIEPEHDARGAFDAFWLSVLSLAE